MKIISLNTWGGRAGKNKLLSFLSEQGPSTDVFCLQEIWSAPYEHLEGAPAGGLQIDHNQIMVYGLQEISKALPDHVPYFRPQHLDNYGLLMMVHKECSVVEEGEVYVYKHKGYIPDGDVGNHARSIQYVTIQGQSDRITVINFHGLWNGKGKSDCAERLEQSDKIVDFIRKIQNPVILCGDFNLLPTTESIQKFEQAGFRNLIKEFDITSTRTSFYTKPEKFADYVFLSADIDLKQFEVLKDEVSDHAPLMVEVG